MVFLLFLGSRSLSITCYSKWSTSYSVFSLIKFWMLNWCNCTKIKAESQKKQISKLLPQHSFCVFPIVIPSTRLFRWGRAAALAFLLLQNMTSIGSNMLFIGSRVLFTVCLKKILFNWKSLQPKDKTTYIPLVLKATKSHLKVEHFAKNKITFEI